MALGGGSFTSYNKVVPGTYINFVSAANASQGISERGVCAIAAKFSWGKEGEIFAVTADDFITNSVKLFGYAYTSPYMRGMRDLFLNASKVYVYRLGQGVKAANSLGEAKYSGVCGNNIKIKVSQNIDNAGLFDVITYYNGVKKDAQKVSESRELVDNDFVVWNKSATLESGIVLNMTGGSDANVTGQNYQEFLNAAENVSFNVLCVATTDSEVNSLVAAYTKRMREDRGIKFQSVLYRTAADDIGVISVDTATSDTIFGATGLLWFVAGASAGCAINKSLTNKLYKGAFEIAQSYTKSQLEEGVNAGKFMLHKVDGEYRVLMDINSLVNTTNEMGDVFKENQTVRIVDQIACDDARLFKEKYLGAVPNDEAGRTSLWNDVAEHRKSLQKMRAIENFKDEDVEVEKGSTKTSVVINCKICPVNSMTHLYITTQIE